ncbi:MAG: acetyl-CoA carboxylase, biotin carboxyl carrier protein [Candidatus Aminicenantes bacterium RBG_13_62_12]|nr:MAG: acetyl-CoA carboxylase, biotin carboxyl carrier protein [Candidatus Aminicenantes bacterium RBG_13_62_12]
MEKPSINYDEILKLIALLEEKKLTHFELEVEGFKIRMSKNTPQAAAPDHKPAPPLPVHHVAAGAQEAEVALGDRDPGLHDITSPMVGTFYRAPNPTSPPFVEVGEPVKKKQTLCIIEAMKLMNEIESEVDGVVKEIFTENAKPVEFGQRLFSILKTG